jgi:NAD(P)-dependent dehydrogenase (short-subunit alcohol dehydrogenase family)
VFCLTLEFAKEPLFSIQLISKKIFLCLTTYFIEIRTYLTYFLRIVGPLLKKVRGGLIRHVPKPEEIDYRKKFDLAGKVIVITGARGLIGSAFVEICAQYNANVVVVDVPSTDPEGFAKSLSKRFNRPMLGASCDVAKRQEVEKLRDLVLDKFQRVDGLVNCHQNVAQKIYTPFEVVTDEMWDGVVETNLKGTFLTCQIFGSWMAGNGGGCIVNMPSTYSVVAPNHALYVGTTEGCPAVYSASKGGVMALSQYLAVYWSKKNVRVNQLTPHGVIPYGDWDRGESSFEERFSTMTPTGRMSFNHEVAPALLFLLSDASSYVTGHNLVVDGGWTTW